MTIEQMVEIPADHRIFLELPRYAPTGVVAQIKINIPDGYAKGNSDTVFPPYAKIEDVRQLLQKEMAEKGTTAVKTASGGGWEAHVRERYAEP